MSQVIMPNTVGESLEILLLKLTINPQCTTTISAALIGYC